MHRIQLESKMQIEQLLYDDCVLGIKDAQYRGFGGFQLWWYDKKAGVCHSAESYWSDTRKQVKLYGMKKAVKVLWHHRKSLFLRTKHMSEDRKLSILNRLQDVQQ